MSVSVSVRYSVALIVVDKPANASCAKGVFAKDRIQIVIKTSILCETLAAEACMMTSSVKYIPVVPRHGFCCEQSGSRGLTP